MNEIVSFAFDIGFSISCTIMTRLSACQVSDNHLFRNRARGKGAVKLVKAQVLIVAIGVSYNVEIKS